MALILLVGGAAVFLVTLAFYLWEFGKLGVSQDQTEWSNFGQFFGGLAGTGVAVVTLAAVAYNIVLQQRELSQASEHMGAQSKALNQQAFDSVFFQLLKTFVDVRETIAISNRKVFVRQMGTAGVRDDTWEGRSAMERIANELVAKFQERHLPGTSSQPFLQEVFLPTYLKYESDLGPYFRNLYHVFKFIDRNEGLTSLQKAEYANIARAQLSKPELCIIFYDGLTPLGTKFKPLIERYGLLKHLNGGTLAHAGDRDDRSLYSARAFMAQADREQLGGHEAP